MDDQKPVAKTSEQKKQLPRDKPIVGKCGRNLFRCLGRCGSRMILIFVMLFLFCCVCSAVFVAVAVVVVVGVLSS